MPQTVVSSLDFKGIILNMQVMTCSSVAILLCVTDYAPSVACVFYLIVYYLHISPFPCVCSFQANRGSVWSYWTSRWIRTTYISSGVKVHFSHIINIDQTTDKPLLQHLYHICIDLHRTCIPQLFFCHTVLSSLCSLHSVMSLKVLRPHSLPTFSFSALVPFYLFFWLLL